MTREQTATVVQETSISGQVSKIIPENGTELLCISMGERSAPSTMEVSKSGASNLNRFRGWYVCAVKSLCDSGAAAKSFGEL